MWYQLGIPTSELRKKLTGQPVLLNSLSHLLESLPNHLELPLVVALALLRLLGRHLLHRLHGGVQVGGEPVKHLHLVVTGT